MYVTDPDLVIVRGINDTWLKENFSQMWVGFGGNPKGVPRKDAFFVGLYIKYPVSRIKYIGVVREIERYNGGADFYLKALVELPVPVNPGHPIRKQEYWSLDQLGLSAAQKEQLRQLINF